jgi:hypothetical protein
MLSILFLSRVSRRLDSSPPSRLHPDVMAALDSNKITPIRAGEFVYVKPDRQLWIPAETTPTGGCGTSALVHRLAVSSAPSSQEDAGQLGTRPAPGASCI